MARGTATATLPVELIDHSPEPPGVCCYGGCDHREVWAASIKPFLEKGDTHPPPPKPVPKENILIPFITTQETPSKEFLREMAARNKWLLAKGNPLDGYGYRWADGSLACCVVRFNLADGGKEVRACRYDGKKWTWKTAGYGPAPLFNLADLLARPEAPVLVVEGEKTVKAARAFSAVSNCVAVCPLGGSSVRPTDWSSLESRQVFVLPDNDPAGEKFAERVVAACRKAKAESVKIVPPARVYARFGLPGECPVGWDLADIKDVLKLPENGPPNA